MLGTDIGPLAIGIDKEPPPTFAGPTGVTVIPVFARRTLTSGDIKTLVVPLLISSVLAWAGTATIAEHKPAARASAAVFDARDIFTPGWVAGTTTAALRTLAKPRESRPRLRLSESSMGEDLSADQLHPS